ncbi:hypothetical protein KIH86_20975 [Paenibacillus sp. HN-1]|uniref:hypothetical protein n=1 Tax=Paenibacillus TaxID=44249 RepID=UPI001CA968FC|nr:MULTISPECIES: hypothetical protein [Paenibacillus]MBY9082529.1 hypothetical protein [Paenibacillus sp. CGMCC 1.18879]MBY9086682.1 hypothetical protein [Paenibacillus sinensis]
MIGWLIVACEIGFWVMILSGLIVRYVFKKRRAGILLLLLTPLIDLTLLLATVWDIRSGAAVSYLHGLAAIYIGGTVAYGHRMINWADSQFAYRFAGGARPAKPPKTGAAHALVERAGWYRHLLAWVIGSALLAAMILMIGQPERTRIFESIVKGWGLVLMIDFVISFSYTLWPRRSTGK